MQVTCHPRLGGALGEGGGHRNSVGSFLYICFRLLCKSELLHKCLWLRIVATEIAIDYRCLLCASL